MSLQKYLLVLSALMLCFGFSAVAQTGPGGVGSTATNRFWYDANDFTGVLADQDRVDTWSSKGGNGTAAVQTNNGRRPEFRDDASKLMNGHPVIEFDGNNDYLQIANNSDINSGGPWTQRTFNLTIRTSNDISNRQCIYEEGSTTRGLNIYIFNGNLYFGAWNFANDGAGSPWGFFSINTAISADTEYVLSYVMNGNGTSTGSIDGYINGTNFGTINNVGTLYGHTGAIGLGANNGGTVYETGNQTGTGQQYDGDIAELIIYNYNLNNAERILVENYLAAKYDIALAVNDHYTMDDGANGDYDNEAAGIGQHTDGSNSTDGQGPSIVRMNNASALANGDFLIWGHDNGLLVETAAQTPASIDYRLTRVWRASETADVGTVNISIDVSGIGVSGAAASDFVLLIDNVDTDFSNATQVVATSFASNIVSFTGVNIADQDHFTLGINTSLTTANSGPGGVGDPTDNRFWYDANDLTGTLTDNQVVSTWTNKGGNTNNATESGGARPTFQSDAASLMNGYPVLRFDGINDRLSISDNTDMNLGTHDEYTFYIAFRTGNDVSSRQILFEEGGTVRGINLYINGGDVYIGSWNLNNDGAGAPWGFSSINTGVTANTDYIIGLVFDGNTTSSGTIEGHLNGNNFGTITNVGLLYQHTGDIGIGAMRQDSYFETGSASGQGNYFGGDMAEFINYNYAVNEAQRIIIENYLAAKYDITLSTNDDYDMDDNANGDFDHEMAGIGQESATDIHKDAKGPGMVRMYLPSALATGDYLFWGHNNEVLCNSDDVPASLTNRLTRAWRVSETSDVGTTNLTFDLSSITYGNIANIRLLIDNDGDFTDATIVNLAGSSGDIAQFTGVNLSDGQYFTVATTDFFDDPNAVTSTWNGGTTDWFTASNWSAGAPDSLTNATISGAASTMPIIGAAGALCRNLTIDNGATLTISGTNALSVQGHWTNNGTFVQNQSTVTILNTCAPCEISSAATQSFYNLTINTPNSATITSGTSQLESTMTITNGKFATGDLLTILSTATETGRIVEIPSTGSISGEIEMQRYIDAGATNWRFITNAVSGSDLEAWDDDFLTSGFPGTDFPNWPTAADPWESMWFYDETIGTTMDDGFVAPTSTANTVAVGEGVWVWCGDNSAGTQPFLIDYRGPVTSGSTSLPVTYTAAGGATEDGWNMVGNPFPCPIDWDAASGWTKTNIANGIYIWNPDLAAYASYVGGVGTNGGTRFIASSQAFMVQATAASPVLTVNEPTKVDANTGFLKAATNPDVLRLQVEGLSLTDETVLRFGSFATDNFDYDWDAQKFYFGTQVGPAISSVFNSREYAINAMADLTQYTEIPLLITVPSSDNYTITATDISGIQNQSCVMLLDELTGITTNLLTDSAYSFYMSDTTTAPRFKLLFTPRQQTQFTGISCNGDANAAITVTTPGNAPFNFQWTDLQGNVLQSGISAVGTDSLSGLGAGSYIVTSSGSMMGCAASIDTVVITEPSVLNPSTSTLGETCVGCCDGEAEVSIVGGTPGYAYLWDDAAAQTAAIAVGLCAGTYEVTITDINGCEITAEAVVENTTGMLETADELGISIYPNPANDLLTLEFERTEQARVQLLNAVGSIVFDENFQAKHTFDLSDLAAGVYLVKIEGGDFTYTQKVVVR